MQGIWHAPCGTTARPLLQSSAARQPACRVWRVAAVPQGYTSLEAFEAQYAVPNQCTHAQRTQRASQSQRGHHRDPGRPTHAAQRRAPLSASC